MRSVATTLVGSNWVVTGDLAQFQKVANLADRHINSLVLAGTSLGGSTVDLSSVARNLVGSSLIVTGTDYQSLSESLADLTARDDIITGWTVVYLAGNTR